jgi:anti-sigma B factor antagonist
MNNDASPAAFSPQAQFEFLTAREREPATVRASGDIDLTNVGQFQAALDQAAATSTAITADLSAVTYCDSATIRALFLAARRSRAHHPRQHSGPDHRNPAEGLWPGPGRHRGHAGLITRQAPGRPGNPPDRSLLRRHHPRQEMAMPVQPNPKATQPIVVTLPGEIDVANADAVRDQLYSALTPGACIVVADLTATTFCDSAGIHNLTLAHYKAATSGIELRVATSPDGPVTRIIELQELHHLLHIYPSLETALTAPTPARE